jgi:hypothetical protein
MKLLITYQDINVRIWGLKIAHKSTEYAKNSPKMNDLWVTYEDLLTLIVVEQKCGTVVDVTS